MTRGKCNWTTPDELDCELERWTAERNARKRVRFGLLLRWGSLWVGCHWSANNKRLCVNLVPCVTFWITMPGGNTP